MSIKMGKSSIYGWLVVWNIFHFPYIGNNHPNWLIFFRGVETANQTEDFLLFQFRLPCFITRGFTNASPYWLSNWCMAVLSFIYDDLHTIKQFLGSFCMTSSLQQEFLFLRDKKLYLATVDVELQMSQGSPEIGQWWTMMDTRSLAEVMVV